MEEVAQESKKRARSATINGRGIKAAGEQIVCSYTACETPVALVSQHIPKAAFLTFPIMVAYVMASKLEEAKKSAIVEAICAEFGQVLSAVPILASIDEFKKIGLVAWHTNFAQWSAHTLQCGKNLADATAFFPKKADKKKAKKEVTHVVFARGVWLVDHKRSPLKSAVLIGGAEESDAQLVVRAYERVTKYCKKYARDISIISLPNGGSVIGAQHSGDAAVEGVNVVAGQAAGAMMVGPCIVLATKQFRVNF